MLGIIGGSGLYRIEGFKKVDEVNINTPFGEPSSSIIIAEYERKKIAFLSRHGTDHSIPPHLVNYRANLWALRKIGVKRILGIGAVGSINESIKPGDYIIISDFIDFTKSRKNTFYEGKFGNKVEGNGTVEDLINSKRVVHVDMTDPYCPEIRNILKTILLQKGYKFVEDGVYVCTEGPRFETPSEIRMFKKLGGDVVGMTGYPEVVLARELALCYASLCVSANPAAGMSDNKLTSEEVIEMMRTKSKEIGEIIKKLAISISDKYTCNCNKSLEGSAT